MKKILLTALTTLFVAACAESPTELVTAGEPSFDELGVVHAASGSAVIPAYRTFTFSAQGMGDGTATGRFTLIRANDQLRVAGRVVCMWVDGNRAFVGTVAETASNPAEVGIEGIFMVEDNGTGSPSPDMISMWYFLPGPPVPGWAQSQCQDPEYDLTSGLTPLQAGNVTVR